MGRTFILEMLTLSPIGRESLICRHLDDGVQLKALAAQAEISLRSAYKWLARFRDSGIAALADRRSVRRTQRRVNGGARK